MKKLFSIVILILFSQFQMLNAVAGSDGETEISSNKNNNQAEVKDCFETINRGVFAFNQGLDKAVFKPLAKGYRKLPQPVRSGTSNVISNIGNVVTIPNNILQGQMKDASMNSLRLIINSTLGIAGIFDVLLTMVLKKEIKRTMDKLLEHGGWRRMLFCITSTWTYYSKRFDWFFGKCHGR